MSVGGNSQPAGQTTNTTAPLPYMYPYIGTALSQAGGLLASGGPQYYPGQEVAGFNPTQQKAMTGIVNAGMNGSPALTAAQGFDQTLLDSGGGRNPYLDQMYSQAAGQTQNQLTGEFAGMGRNPSASEPLRAEQLNNLATSLYGGQYQNDMQDALAAGKQAQSLYDTRLQGLNAAEGVGQQVQNLSQNLIDASRNAYNYDQNLPWQQLQQYEGLLRGVQPGTASSTPYFTNPMANALGMGLGAEKLYNGMGGKSGNGGIGTTNIDSSPWAPDSTPTPMLSPTNYFGGQ
jgi:hypothetical protein